MLIKNTSLEFITERLALLITFTLSHCRGLSIGHWSPMYSVLFQLLLARLLVSNIRQQFRLCKHFQQKDSNKC